MRLFSYIKRKVDELIEILKQINENYGELVKEQKKTNSLLEKLTPNSTSNNHSTEKQNDDIKKREKNTYMQRITNKMEAYGLTVKGYKTHNDFKPIYLNTAMFIGKHYLEVKDFLKLLKRCISDHKEGEMDLKEFSSKKICSICFLAQTLNTLDILESYSYSKAPDYILKFKPMDKASNQNFITGKWLEIYTMLTIKSIISKASLKGDVMCNLQMHLENGDSYELDVVAIIESKIYWIECKTNKYQSYIPRYESITELLNLDANHAFVLVGNTQEDYHDETETLTICNLCTFAEEFKQAVENRKN